MLGDYFKFKNSENGRFLLKISDMYPCLREKTLRTGFDRHYVYHTAWAARIVQKINPSLHIDISSSLYFSGIISSFIPVQFYDYRPAEIMLDNLESKRADITKLTFPDNSIKSLSCMHVVEHVGLGRYGDSIDAQGDIKAMNELARVLAPGGSLLFVVPVSRSARIEFNAHRIYTYTQIMGYFRGLSLREFALIPEDGSRGGLIRNANPNFLEFENYACGCFWFVKE